MAMKRFVRDMDFKTEASEPVAFVITKSNRNERGSGELRNGDWWTGELIPKAGRSLFQEKAGFFITRSIFLRYSSVARLNIYTHGLIKRTMFRRASFKTHNQG